MPSATNRFATSLRRRKSFLAEGEPVIALDSKTEGPVGGFKNPGLK